MKGLIAKAKSYKVQRNNKRHNYDKDDMKMALMWLNDELKLENKDEILAKFRVDLEEYGDIHDDNCGVNMEDECNCLTFEIIVDECEKALNKLNTYWVEHLKAHRPHCSPQGNKILTQIKKNSLINKDTTKD